MNPVLNPLGKQNLRLSRLNSNLQSLTLNSQAKLLKASEELQATRAKALLLLNQRDHLRNQLNKAILENRGLIQSLTHERQKQLISQQHISELLHRKQELQELVFVNEQEIKCLNDLAANLKAQLESQLQDMQRLFQLEKSSQEKDITINELKCIIQKTQFQFKNSSMLIQKQQLFRKRQMDELSFQHSKMVQDLKSFQHQNAQLNARCQHFSQIELMLKSDNQKLHHQLSELKILRQDNKVSTFAVQSQKEIDSRTIANLRHQLSLASNQISALRGKMDEQSASFFELRRSSQDCQSKLSILACQNNSLKAESNMLNSQLHKLKAMETDFRFVQDSNKQMSNQLESARETLRKNALLIKQLEEKHSLFCSSLVQDRRQSINQSVQKEEIIRKLQRLVQENIRLDEQLKSEASERDILRGNCLRLQQSMEALTLQLESREAENNILRNQISERNSEQTKIVYKLNSEIKQLRRELDDTCQGLKRQSFLLTESRQQLRELQQQHRRLNQQKIALKIQNQASQQSTLKLNRQAERLNSQFQALSFQFVKVNQSLKAKVKFQEAQRAKFQIMKALQKNQSKQLQQLKQTNQVLQEELRKVRGEVAKLRSEGQQLLQISRQSQQIKDQNGQLCLRIKKLQEELRKEREENEVWRKEFTQWQRKIQFMHDHQ